MKSIVGACFLLTTGIGDMLIVVINLIHFTDNYAVLFLSYTVLMFVVITIFALMCIFYYKYADYTETTDEDNDESESSSGELLRACVKGRSLSFLVRLLGSTNFLHLDSHNDSYSTQSIRPILNPPKLDPFEDAWQTKL